MSDSMADDKTPARFDAPPTPNAPSTAEAETRSHDEPTSLPEWIRANAKPQQRGAALIERLGSAPHWRTAVRRATSLSGTDPRARAWMDDFIARAMALADGAEARSDSGQPADGRFAIGSAGIAIPPELTAILRDALVHEGPVLRAAVFMLVGAAVRAPLVPTGTNAPWDTYEKLRMIAKALPPGRRGRWCDALPRPAAGHVALPASMAGRRLIARGFSDTVAGRNARTGDIEPLPRPGATLPIGASVDLLLSALTFRACAELADGAAKSSDAGTEHTGEPAPRSAPATPRRVA